MRELLDRSLGDEVRVTFDLPGSLWPVDVDPSELELVVLNLTVNARDAMPRGGTIIVRGENVPNVEDEELAGDYVRLSVIDTGMGIPPEVQERVFEPFFTTKDVGKGSGLGLAQVYGFAKQSRGTVRIESEVGRGTCVAVYLPRSDKAPLAEQHHLADKQMVGEPGRDAGCVLLVEDDDEVAALVSEMLEQLGYEVTRAASAKAALGALANGRRVDLVFSDVMMPGGMNGVELAREIRTRFGTIPVLLTSGYADVAAQAATEEGLRILQKPYRIEELSALLAETGSHRVRAMIGSEHEPRCSSGLA
jgi:CheY-like chemotaxis protein